VAGRWPVTPRIWNLESIPRFREPPGRHPGDQALVRLDGRLQGSPKGIKTISHWPAGSFLDPNWQTLDASEAEQNPETGQRIETVEWIENLRASEHFSRMILRNGWKSERVSGIAVLRDLLPKRR
jgi:hypothetical protein